MSLQTVASHPLLRSRVLRATVVVAALWGAGTVWNVRRNAPPVVEIPAHAQTPSPNAYDDFLRAVALKAEPPDGASRAVSLKVDPSHAFYSNVSPTDPMFHPSAADLARMQAKVEAVQAIIRAGFAHAYAEPRQSTPGNFKPMAGFRSLARTLQFEAMLQESKGDWAGAVQTRLDGIQLGVVIPHGGNVIMALVGGACEAIAEKRIWGDVDHLTAEQAAMAAHRLESIDARRESPIHSLKEDDWDNERYLQEMMRGKTVPEVYRTFLQIEDASYEMAGVADKIADPLHKSGDDNEFASGLHRPVKERLYVQFLMLTQSKQRIMDGVVAIMKAREAAVPARYDGLRQTHFSPSPSDDPILRDIVLAGEMVPSFLFKDSQMRMRSGLLTLDLALHAFRLRHGAYPASLSDLVTAGLLAHVPEDPFAKVAGTPFRYRQQTGSTFLLYSVGPDGVDDGGWAINNGNRSADYFSMDSIGDWVVGANTASQARGGAR